MFWGQVTSFSNPVIFGKQRAKVSWMSGVSRRPEGFRFHPNRARRTMNVSVCSFYSPCLLPFRLEHSTEDILIYKENKHRQKDGKYKE